jgi:acetylornithine deacetylase
VGHVDVVPPGDPSTWTVDPWAGAVRDGAMYGRGACDMKGGVVAILAALRSLVATGAAERLGGEVLGVFVPSEEDGGQGMLAAIRAGCTGDMAVITEPSNLDVVIAHAGAITFRLVVPGRAAHASVRREGVSALDSLYTLIHALEADEAARNAAETDPLMTALGLPYPTIVGKVEGGEWASTVLDRVVVEGRYGVRLGQTWRDAEADLRACIDAACAADPFLRDHEVELEITGGRFSSSRVPAEHPLPVSLADAVEATLGRRPALLGEPYGADMRLLVNEGRTPTVIFGPGDVRFAHSADEHVPLDEVADCARALATWVVSELVSDAASA